MATYFTADCHFGHNNIIKHCKRPFETLEEMNETMIANWNSRVHKDDHVYIAGDFAWRGSCENAIATVKRLKGIKHLAIGNHDKDFLKSEEYRSLFEEISQLLFVSVGEGRVIICHYPMASWNGSHRGAWHVYGHIHNNLGREGGVFSFMATRERALNAGVDICGFMPVTFKELINYNQAFREGIAAGQ